VARSKNGAGKKNTPSKRGAASRSTKILADPPGDLNHSRPLAWRKSKPYLAALVTIAVIAIGALALFGVEGGLPLPEALRIESARPALTFVGSEACANCHQSETALWEQSQH
jgi:hypothetical protein